MATIPKPDDREEWLALRRPYFNASATSVLFDRHPFMSPGRYATIKLTGTEQAETEAMIRGRMLEDALARWWSYRHDNVEIWEPGLLYVEGRVMATMDRWSDLGPVEVKTTRHYTDEGPELYWLDQCQAIMLCTGSAFINLVWMDGHQALYERRLEADPAWQQAIIDGANAFMGQIDLGLVPEGATLDYDDAAALHPFADVAKVELDIDAATAVQEYRVSRRHRIEWGKKEDRAKAAIASALGDAEVGTYNGEPVVRWFNPKPTERIDAKALREAEPAIAERFTVEVTSRRMALLGKDEEADD